MAKKYKKTFYVDRARWSRGVADDISVGTEPSALLCDDGTMCILGFYAKSCRVPAYMLRGCETLDELRRLGSPGYKRAPMVPRLTRWHEETITSINDHPGHRGPKQQERAIAQRFSELGIRVVFHGKGRPS